MQAHGALPSILHEDLDIGGRRRLCVGGRGRRLQCTEEAPRRQPGRREVPGRRGPLGHLQHREVVLQQEERRPSGGVGLGKRCLQAPGGRQPQQPEVGLAGGDVQKGLAATVPVQLQGLWHALEEHREEALGLWREWLHAGNEVEQGVTVTSVSLTKIDTLRGIRRKLPHQKQCHLRSVEGAGVPEHGVALRVPRPSGDEASLLDNRRDRAHIAIDNGFPKHLRRGQVRLRRVLRAHASKVAAMPGEALKALGELVEGLVQERGHADVLQFPPRHAVLEQRLEVPRSEHIGALPEQRQGLIQQCRDHRCGPPGSPLEAQVELQRALSENGQLAPCRQ
mmetsp:Transcript_68964/g.224797  ORF Transcript_68964/g.224797 Transcript_68964/m.224797 type:complete len:337 (+) Transcript_68964:400-1410(+)